MGRFVEGQDRRQAAFLPECLDDYVASDNPVRVIANGRLTKAGGAGDYLPVVWSFLARTAPSPPHAHARQRTVSA